MTPLEGKCALVTGGGRGIGRAVAAALVRRGVSVLVCGRDPGALDRTVVELSALAPVVVAGQTCDVRDLGQVRALCDRAEALWGRLDILVNNAGVGHVVPFQDMTVDQWRETIDINLNGVFNCCHAALPLLRAGRDPHIVNMSSRSARNPFPCGTSYNASKFGLNGFTEALVMDLKPLGIKVSQVFPGRVSTDFAGEEPKNWHIAPADVADAVVHMLSAPRRILVSGIDLRPAFPGASG